METSNNCICIICGRALEFNTAEVLEASGQRRDEPLAPVCTGCVHRLDGKRPGLAFSLESGPVGSLFALGRVVVTPKAIATLTDSGLHAAELLERHAALQDASRIVSLVQTSAGRLWIATDIHGGATATIIVRVKESRVDLRGLPHAASA